MTDKPLIPYTIDEITKAISKLRIEAEEWRQQHLLSGKDYSRTQYINSLSRIDVLQKIIIDNNSKGADSSSIIKL